jgi:Ala-tRNA(Pro) deacylase
MAMHNRLQEYLASRGARFDLVGHPEAFTSQEEAAAAHVSGWRWIKAVVVKHPHGFALAVLPAACEVDLDRLEGLMGMGELRLASAEEMLRLAPDFELGALPPFGELIGVPTFADEVLFEQRMLVGAGGDHRTAIRVRSEEFARLAQARVGRFARHGSEFPARAPSA